MKRQLPVSSNRHLSAECVPMRDVGADYALRFAASRTFGCIIWTVLVILQMLQLRAILTAHKVRVRATCSAQMCLPPLELLRGECHVEKHIRIHCVSKRLTMWL